MKRLICCSDGTWNTPTEKDGNCITPTNVSLFYDHIPASDQHGITQLKFYDKGVGTGDLFDKIGGGITGIGINKNILDTYTFLVENYKPGDEIYLLGFSRGAYTARSVAGFIYNCGILKQTDKKIIQEAFELYRRRDDNSHPRANESMAFKQKYSYPEEKIQFIGVWDTVGALGIPGRIFDLFNKDILHCEFHDVKLSSLIQHAYHAVAIDEHREPFEPTLWVQTERGIQAGQVLEQMWFAGAHSDVGGGYKEHGLSDCTLLWMIEKAQACGLMLKKPNDIHPNPNDEIHNPMNIFYRLKGVVNRVIGNGKNYNEKISRQAAQRWAANSQNYQQEANPNLRPYMHPDKQTKIPTKNT